MSRTKRTTAPHALRRQAHVAELRAVPAALEQGVHVRRKRQARRLPDPWDDKPVAALYELDHKK